MGQRQREGERQREKGREFVCIRVYEKISLDETNRL